MLFAKIIYYDIPPLTYNTHHSTYRICSQRQNKYFQTGKKYPISPPLNADTREHACISSPDSQLSQGEKNLIEKKNMAKNLFEIDRSFSLLSENCTTRIAGCMDIEKK